MTFLPNELRLAYTILINALIFWSAFRLIKKLTPESETLQHSLDASLLSLIVIYLAVGIPGVACILSPISMLVAALVLIGAMELLRRRIATPIAAIRVAEPGGNPRVLEHGTRKPVDHDRWFVAFSFFFVLAYVATIAYIQRTSPVLSHDALTYHVPAAIYWLQTHRLGLFDVWFYNPANTYSPLTGSMYIAWLLAPMGNDVLGKFAQAPAMFVVLLGMIQLCRAMGTRPAVGAIIGIAAVCSRPFISQSTIAKDDLWLAAFFLMAMVGCSRPRLQDRIGPYRLGAAIGMFFAIKYTALFTLPIFVLVIDAPFRAKWRARQWGIAMACAVLLAGPWYLRNWILTGNPLYPTDVTIGGITIFRGMFTTLRSAEFGSLGRDWLNLTKGYFQMTPQVAWPLFIFWFAAIVLWLVAALLRVRPIVRTPLVRAAVFGPILGLLFYFTKSPYAEMRFVYPSLLLMFAAVGVLFSQLDDVKPVVAIVLACLLALFAAGTGFVVPWGPYFTAGSIVVGIIGALVWFGMARLYRRNRNAFALICTALVLVTAGWVYTAWPAFMSEARAQPGPTWAMTESYGPGGEAWQFVRDQLPAKAPLAYANTYLLYPLYGFNLDRPVFYVPGRPNLHHLHDLPRFDEPTTGEEIPGRVVPLTNRGFDVAYWLDAIRKSGAQYLFVGKQDLSKPKKQFDSPELLAARAHPEMFEPVFENQAAEIFKIK